MNIAHVDFDFISLKVMMNSEIYLLDKDLSPSSVHCDSRKSGCS
jgi:hypothetical protein